jgi:hypothetical protein
MAKTSHPTVSGQGNRPSRSEHPELVEGRSRRLLRQAQDASTRLFCKSVRWLVAKIERSITINAPVEKVFAYIENPMSQLLRQASLSAKTLYENSAV